MCKIKKNDTVIVIAGKDKGKVGTVKAVLPLERRHGTVKSLDFRVVVEGANLRKHHVRPNPSKEIPGGIVERESGMHISNVAMYNPVTQKADKVGYKTLGDGKKVRIYKSSGEVVGHIG